MADRWAAKRSVNERIADKTRKLSKGDLDGRVQRATPVPYFPPMKYPNSAQMEIYVQPDEPNTSTIGALWFDTDEPVPD